MWTKGTNGLWICVHIEDIMGLNVIKVNLSPVAPTWQPNGNLRRNASEGRKPRPNSKSVSTEKRTKKANP